MKLGVFFANAGPFSDPALFRALVEGAEHAGMESIWVVEHVVVPVGYESRYPYSSDGRMPGPENSPIPDPLLSLSFAAAISSRLKLATGIVIAPQRHPVYLAKELATLDVLSGGRAIAGIGIGWLREEFEVLGIPFEERAARTEETVAAMRSLWSEKAEPFAGDFFRWAPVESNPKPVQPGGVPIVVGGHVEGAARRAARIGDGFFPARGSFETLPGLLDALRDECARVGRKPEEIEVSAGAGPLDTDTVKRYEDLGVSRLVVPPPAFDRDGLRRGFEGLVRALG